MQDQTWLAERVDLGHAVSVTAAQTNDSPAIPSAPVDDLDLDCDDDEEEWERRVMELASDRIRAARARLEHMGIVDAKGEPISRSLPPDMKPESDATLDTG